MTNAVSICCWTGADSRAATERPLMHCMAAATAGSSARGGAGSGARNRPPMRGTGFFDRHRLRRHIALHVDERGADVGVERPRPRRPSSRLRSGRLLFLGIPLLCFIPASLLASCSALSACLARVTLRCSSLWREAQPCAHGAARAPGGLPEGPPQPRRTPRAAPAPPLVTLRHGATRAPGGLPEGPPLPSKK